MKSGQHREATLRSEFLKPVQQALQTAENTREVQGLDDWRFLQTWLLRTLDTVKSSRGWLQKVRSVLSFFISISGSMRTLKSERRLSLVEEVNESVVSQNDALTDDDPFKGHEELKGFAIYAADGHYQQASAHEEPNHGKKRSTAHFFAANLRTHAMQHLDIARPDVAPKKKEEHGPGDDRGILC